MRKITFLAAMLIAMAGHSQNFEWVKTPPLDFDMNHDLISYSTTTDPAGNTYFTGFKANMFPYENIMGTQFFNKYSPAGNLIFSKELVGNINVDHVTADLEGNVYMAVGYVTTMTVGELTLSTVNEGVNHLLLKFDTQGNLLWHQELIIGDLPINGFMSIAFDAANNVYIAYDDYINSYIKKLSPGGETLLTIEQVNAARITSVSVDKDGNIYAAGSCVAPQSVFGGVSTGTEFAYNIYAVKYSSQGTFQWIKFVEDITCPAPMIVANTPDAVYFSSQLYDISTFDNIDVEGPINSFEDMFIAKLNASGEYQWVKDLPGEGLMGTGNSTFLALDNDDNLYFAGRVGGNINWGNGIMTNTPAFSSDLLVIKYNPEGEVLFAKTAGGEENDRIDAITIANDNSIYISGMVSGPVAFDNITTEAAAFDVNPFLAKLGQGALGINDNEATVASFFPNPASDLLTIKLQAAAEGSIYNLMGQKVKDIAITDAPIPVAELEAGVYIVSIPGYQNIKFIKN